MRKPHVVKTCPQCNTTFSKPPSLARAIFCGKGCADAAQTTSARKDVECATCGVVFSAKRDHGVWQKFCSRLCFRAKSNYVTTGNLVPMEPTRWTECPQCKSMFEAVRSGNTETGYRTFCSTVCRHQSQLAGELRDCVNCGIEFYIRKSTAQKSPDESCCSRECRNEFYVGTQSTAFVSGQVQQQGQKFLYLPRDGYVGRYIGEHRLVAATAIGRMLERHEVVIRINRRRDDNRPENLFICGTISEFGKRRNGSMEWPLKSNLKEYK